MQLLVFGFQSIAKWHPLEFGYYAVGDDIIRSSAILLKAIVKSNLNIFTNMIIMSLSSLVNC